MGLPGRKNVKKPLQILPQEMWRRREPAWRGPIRADVGYVFLTVTDSKYCMRSNSCFKVLRYLQAFHRGKSKCPDIPYNFLIGGDGIAYEGRGWGVRPTLPKRYLELQSRSIFVAFVGHFIDETPTEKMFKARRELIEFGIQNKHINSKFLEFNI